MQYTYCIIINTLHYAINIQEQILLYYQLTFPIKNETPQGPMRISCMHLYACINCALCTMHYAIKVLHYAQLKSLIIMVNPPIENDTPQGPISICFCLHPCELMYNLHYASALKIEQLWVQNSEPVPTCAPLISFLNAFDIYSQVIKVEKSEVT